jgi:hypothetical protein
LERGVLLIYLVKPFRQNSPSDLTEQMRIFTEARTLLLEARQNELRAELAAAQARNEEANMTLERSAMAQSRKNRRLR